jgi:hypothetical protein
MLNSAVFGGVEAGTALRESMFDDEQKQVGHDWCVGGCQKWQDTDEGKQRFIDIKERFDDWGKEHPEEYAALVKTH